MLFQGWVGHGQVLGVVHSGVSLWAGAWCCSKAGLVHGQVLGVLSTMVLACGQVLGVFPRLGWFMGRYLVCCP